VVHVKLHLPHSTPHRSARQLPRFRPRGDPGRVEALPEGTGRVYELRAENTRRMPLVGEGADAAFAILLEEALTMTNLVQPKFSRAATLAAAALLAISPVVAQTSVPEGKPATKQGRCAAPARCLALPVSTTCGPSAKRIVKTQSESENIWTDEFEFVKLAGAEAAFSVNPRVTRCITVLFTAEAACGDFCYIQAILNGARMTPDGEGLQVLASKQPLAEAHAYEWVERVGPGHPIHSRSGTYKVEIQISNGGFDLPARLDDWTFDAELLR
jgi:hypothetical protein